MIKPIQIILLTHEREVERLSNTGQLALQAYPEYCQRVIWSRVDPDPSLVHQLESGQAALLFLENEDNLVLQGVSAVVEELRPPLKAIDRSEHVNPDRLTHHHGMLPDVVVILDATWQEARKMCRRSGYLKQAEKYALPTSIFADTTSKFTLRRNQIEGGFCTLECVQQLFSLNAMHEEAAVLATMFKAFNQR
ncbi:DTW domain-containing protein [Shewanella surugensis]|uniref:tRNA-uridine aminocarboxypropyltransferase n=1 Tax=Shewanella surugensis TaxID=212020 RepID=A0ABT0LFJ8_9GAMM|nr:DTW domain-containing protein [Shewanella surugensis]MCL1126339.1 DTW domain-containing protein [Shewanella surugensis]